MRELKYVVWVGGVDNLFNSKFEAQCEAQFWNRKGYNDVQIEEMLRSLI